MLLSNMNIDNYFGETASTCRYREFSEILVVVTFCKRTDQDKAFLLMMLFLIMMSFVFSAIRAILICPCVPALASGAVNRRGRVVRELG